MSVVDRSNEGGQPADKREARMREEFKRYYRKFEGKVYLPLFAVKTGRSYEVLDYYRHLLSQVEVMRFDYESVDWNLADALTRVKDSFYRLTLDHDLERVDESANITLENDNQVLSWLVASLPFEQFSHKQLRVVANQVRDGLYRANPELQGRLGLVKFILREKVIGLIEQETDRQTHEAFEYLFATNKLSFALECVEARVEIPPIVELKAARRLVRDDGDQIQQSLFDYVPDDAFNDYEKAVALYLDNCPQVLWWYRNLVGPENFKIQGYKRNRIYPDFVVQEGKPHGNEKKPIAPVLVLESKGTHLKGNEDTKYKRSVADYFGKVGHRVPWQKLAEDFRDNMFRVQVLDEGEYKHDDWRDKLKKLFEESAREVA